MISTFLKVSQRTRLLAFLSDTVSFSTTVGTFVYFVLTAAPVLLFMTILLNVFILATWEAPRDWDEIWPDFNISWFDS